MLKDPPTSIKFPIEEGKISENIFPTSDTKLSPVSSFHSAKPHKPVPEDTNTHTSSLSHACNTSLSCSPCPSEPSLPFLQCAHLFSIITTSPHFFDSDLAKTKTTTHTQRVLPSFSTLSCILTFYYLLSSHYWNHSCDFCLLKWCWVFFFLYHHWFLSLTFFPASTLGSPWLPELHLCLSLLTAEASFSIPIFHGNLSRLSFLVHQYPVTLAPVHLSWSFHPSIHPSSPTF